MQAIYAGKMIRISELLIRWMGAGRVSATSELCDRCILAMRYMQLLECVSESRFSCRWRGILRQSDLRLFHDPCHRINDCLESRRVNAVVRFSGTRSILSEKVLR